MKPAQRPSTTQRPIAAGAPAGSSPGTEANHTEGPLPSTAQHMGPGGLEALVPGEPRARPAPGPAVRRRCPRPGRRPVPARAIRTSAVTSRRQPCSSRPAQSALLRALGARWPPGCRRAGPVPRTSGVTRPSASPSGRPGSPSGSTELARRVNPPAARSRHSPRSSLSTGCQARAVTRASSPKEAAGPRRRAGAGGTTLPATSADSAMRTVSPLFVVTDSTPSSHDVRTPTVSVNFAPSPGTSATRRTDTRLPTSAGVMRTSSRPPMVNSTALSAPPVRIVPRNGDTRGGHRRRRAPAREPTPYRGGTTA